MNLEIALHNITIWTILNIYSSHCKSIYIYIQNNIYYNIQHHWALSLHHACLKGDSGDCWWSIYVLIYSICFSLSDLLYSVWWGLSSSTSLAYIILKIVLMLQFQKGSYGPPSIFTLREPQPWQKGKQGKQISEKFRNFLQETGSFHQEEEGNCLLATNSPHCPL